jgi:predicted nucleic acid-binding Zn ribbon protein
MSFTVERNCSECGRHIPEDRTMHAVTCSRECGLARAERRKGEADKVRWLRKKAAMTTASPLRHDAPESTPSPPAGPSAPEAPERGTSDSGATAGILAFARSLTPARRRNVRLLAAECRPARLRALLAGARAAGCDYAERYVALAMLWQLLKGVK